jgi:hypothetical protein
MAKGKQLNKQSASEPVAKTVPAGDILLDPYNPRLSSDEKGASQPDLMRILIEKFKIEELADSIIATGYRPFDPLIGYDHKGRVTVLEGNRRVAAVKLLLNPELAPDKYLTRWRQLSRKLPADFRKQMEELTLTVYPRRDDADVTAYIGFRHVTGVLPWPAYEKAGFIAQMIDRGETYDSIADRLGSYPSHVERHYVAYQLVQQAENEDIPGAENMSKFFGVLLRALQSPDISNFLGVKFPKNPRKSRRPVPKNKLAALIEFVRWTFGTSENERVLPDSRQLTKWGTILHSPVAVRYLRSARKPDFERAWFKTGGQTETLVESLHAAADRLEESLPLITTEMANDADITEGVRRCFSLYAQNFKILSQNSEGFWGSRYRCMTYHR